MIYVYAALGLVAIVVLVVQFGGAMLPVKHTASVSRELPALPEEVWAALTDVEGYTSWRSELNSIEKVGEDPLSWVETSRFGKMPLTVEKWEPPTRMIARIDSKGMPFGGAWTYSVEPTPTGTKLTITEDGEVYPPAFRFLSKFVFGHTKTIEGYLAQLEKHLAKGEK